MKRGCLDSVANCLKSTWILQENDLLNAKNVAVSSTTGATSTIICGSILARNPSNVRSVRRTFLARPLCGITWRYTTRARDVQGSATVRRAQRTNRIPRLLMNKLKEARLWTRYCLDKNITKKFINKEVCCKSIYSLLLNFLSNFTNGVRTSHNYRVLNKLLCCVGEIVRPNFDSNRYYEVNWPPQLTSQSNASSVSSSL